MKTEIMIADKRIVGGYGRRYYQALCELFVFNELLVNRNWQGWVYTKEYYSSTSNRATPEDIEISVYLHFAKHNATIYIS